MPIKSSDIEQKLILIISELNDDEVPTLQPDTPIAEAGLDSLDAVNLLFEIEDHYGISIEDTDEINERVSLGTISELAIRVKEELEKSAEEASAIA
jgi:acyl carrier protein